MMRKGLGILVMGLLLAGTAHGAVLELRTSDATIAVGESTTVEIVLTVAAGEDVSAVSAAIEAAEADLIELVNFVAGDNVAADAFFDRSNYLEDNTTLPLEDGAALADYLLNAYVEGPEAPAALVDGAGEYVIETVTIRGLASGTVDLAFNTGGDLPSPTSASGENTGVALPAELPLADPDRPLGDANVLYLGVGDVRGGGAGALTITIGTTPVQPTQPAFCGFGVVGCMLFCFAGLGLMKRNRR